jgi:beta-lactamase class A
MTRQILYVYSVTFRITKSRALPLSIAIVFFAGGFFAAHFFLTQPATNSAKLSAAYPLLAKRIFIEDPNDTIINFVPLRRALEEKFAALTVPYSFSFEYIPTGTTIRIGDDKELVGASLLKLPVVMDLYRAAELGKVDLDQTVTIQPNELNDQFGDLWKRGAGAKLKLREAAKLALVQSDNTAILIVQHHIPADMSADDQALSAVDADYNATADQVTISSKSFSSILKCLYFTCYLNRDDSQEILSDLSGSDFDTQITAPIPQDVVVAHKIGVQFDKLTESDCGIFYVPKRPYLLCMMVGLPTDQANQFMSDVSSTVYKAVTQHN